MSGTDKNPTDIAGVVCQDGLCRVVKPTTPLSIRKLGFAGPAVDNDGAQASSSTGTATGGSNSTGVKATPARRPFLVDLLHGDVDLERFFKD